jgi:hypothetical protein
MNFYQFIVTLEASNPGMCNGENKITMTVAALKKLLLKAHNNGYQDRVEVEKTCEALKPKNPFDSLFGRGK